MKSSNFRLLKALTELKDCIRSAEDRGYLVRYKYIKKELVIGVVVPSVDVWLTDRRELDAFLQHRHELEGEGKMSAVAADVTVRMDAIAKLLKVPMDDLLLPDRCPKTLAGTKKWQRILSMLEEKKLGQATVKS